MVFQAIHGAVKLLGQRWRLLKASGTTPEIAVISGYPLSLRSCSCSFAGVCPYLQRRVGDGYGEANGKD